MPPATTDMVPAGPRNSVIVHPEDEPSLQLAGVASRAQEAFEEEFA